MLVVVKVKDTWISIALRSIVFIMKTSDESDRSSDEEEDSKKKKKVVKKKKSEKKQKQENTRLSDRFKKERRRWKKYFEKVAEEGAVDTDTEENPPKQLHYRWKYKDLPTTYSKSTGAQSVDYTKRMKRFLKYTEKEKEGRFFYSDNKAKIEEIADDRLISVPKTMTKLEKEEARVRHNLLNREQKERAALHKELLELAKKDKSAQKNHLWYKWRKHDTQQVYKIPPTREVLEQLKERREHQGLDLKFWKRDPGVLGEYKTSDDDLSGSELLGNEETKAKMSTRAKKSVKSSLKKKPKKVSSSEEEMEKFESEDEEMETDVHSEELSSEELKKAEEDSGLLSEVIPKEESWLQKMKSSASASATATSSAVGKPDSASTSTVTATQSKPLIEAWSVLNEDQNETSQDTFDEFKSDQEEDTSQDSVLSDEEEPEEEIEAEILEPDITLDHVIEKCYRYFQQNEGINGQMMEVSELSQKKYGLPPICSERMYYRTRAEHIKQMTQRFLEKTLNAMEGGEEDEEESEEEEKPKEKKKKKGSGRGGPKKKKKH